jgi:hypothetical protein
MGKQFIRIIFMFIFLLATLVCNAQTDACKIKGESGTLFVEVVSCNVKTGKVSLVIQNSTSRHVNIRIYLHGNFENYDKKSVICYDKIDIFPPGKKTITVNVNQLFSSGKGYFPYSIDKVILSGPDYDGYVNTNPTTGDLLRDFAERQRSNR